MTPEEHILPLEANTKKMPPEEIIRVLHIDDDENIQMFLKIFIEADPNIKVTSIQNAADAIQLIQTNTYDCLVSDYDMPEINGITLAEKIRKNSNIPIIIYTGRGSEEIAERAFAAGIDDYIRKENAPAHYQIVAKRIRQAVERKRINEGYKNLFDKASDGIILHTLDGVILDVNEVICKRLGYTKEELLGNPLNLFASPINITVQDKLNTIFEQGHAFFEANHNLKEGGFIPVEVNARKIKYMGSDAILSFIRDVSDRKLLERKIKERLEALQHHALELGKCENLASVAQTTYRILHEVMGYSFFGLAVVNGDIIRFMANVANEENWQTEYPLNGKSITARVVRTGSTIMIPDVRHDPNYVGPRSGPRYLSEIIIPVKVGGRVVAVLNIEDEMRERFTNDDKVLLEIFSEHIASAFQKISLLESSKKYLSRIEAINQHAVHSATLSTIEDVVEYTYQVLDELFGFSDGCIGIVEDGVIKLSFARNLTVQIPDVPINARGITSRACRTGKSQRVNDTRLDSDYVKNFDFIHYLSELDVPVVIEGRVVAVINLEDTRLGFFSEEDQQIVEVLAKNLGSAISRIQQLEIISTSKSALMQSEKRFRYLLDSAPEGITVNLLGKLKYVNQHFAEMIGYTVEELLKKTVSEITTENQRRIIEERTKKRAKGEDVSSIYESELIRRNGSILPVEYSVSRINFNGEAASLTFIRDLTQVKEKERLENRIIALHSHAHELNELRSEEEVARVTLDILHQHLNCNLLSIRLFDGENLNMLARWGAKPLGKPIPINGKGLMARVAREKQTILSNNTHTESDFLRGPNNALSELVTPILCKGELLGVLNAESIDLNAFNENDRILVEALADEIGSTMKRIKAVEQERVYNSKLEALKTNAIKLSQAKTLDEVLDTACEILKIDFGYTWAGLGIVDDKVIHYIRVIGTGLVENSKIPLNQRCITTRAVKSGETQLVLDTNEDEDYILVNPQDGIARSELVVPIRVSGRIEFVVNVEGTKPKAFSIQDQHLLELLGSHFASAMELIRKKEKLDAIYIHASLLSLSADLQEIAKHTLATVKDVLEFQISSFHVVNGNTIKMIETTGFSVNHAFTQAKKDPGIIPYAVREGRSVYVPDTEKDRRYRRGPFTKGEVRSSEFVVPILIRGVVVAVINLESKRRDGFSAEDRELVELLADHVASAISRVEQTKAILKSDEKYRKILDSSLDSVLLLSGTKIIYVNKKMVELLGYEDASELIGADITSTLTNDEKEKIRQRTLSRQRGEPQPDTYEIELIRRDGTTVEVEAAVSLTEYDGRPAVISSVRDISDRKRYQKKLTQLHESGVGFAMASTRDEIWDIALNTMNKTLGFDFAGVGIVEDHFVKYVRSVGAVLPNGWKLDLLKPSISSRAIESGMPQLVADTSLDPEYLFAPGSVRLGSELACPIVVNGIPLAILNIESMKSSAFSEEDMHLLQILVGQVASALDKIAHLDEQIKQSETRQKELIDGVERISGMVRHDLRSPLQIIQNASYLLERKYPSAEEYTNKINASVEYAAKILDDLKTITKPMELNMVSTNLGELVEKSIENASIPATIVVDKNLKTLNVEVDQYRIRRVIDNLIKNACEAMPDGGTLKVSLSSAKEEACLLVGDTGRGIPLEAGKKLFTPFYTTKSSGTGLGLVICKQIVEAHDGEISFESMVGKGTTFSVMLPLKWLSTSDGEVVGDQWNIPTSLPGFRSNAGNRTRRNQYKN